MAVFPALQGGPHNHQCLACRNPRELLTTTRPRCSDMLVETQKNPPRSQEPTSDPLPKAPKFGDASPLFVAHRIGALAAQLLEAGMGSPMMQMSLKRQPKIGWNR